MATVLVTMFTEPIEVGDDEIDVLDGQGLLVRVIDGPPVRRLPTPEDELEKLDGATLGEGKAVDDAASLSEGLGVVKTDQDQAAGSVHEEGEGGGDDSAGLRDEGTGRKKG